MCYWLTPVDLSLWKAEIGRIVVQSQPGQKMFMRHNLNQKKLGEVVHTCHLYYGVKYKIHNGSRFRQAWT
jgi:hypothetical protein